MNMKQWIRVGPTTKPGSILELLSDLPCDCAHPGDGDPLSGLGKEYAQREIEGNLKCDRCRAIEVLKRDGEYEQTITRFYNVRASMASGPVGGKPS